MKKFLCIVMALLMAFCMMSTVLAADTEFVPSISYKGAPTIVTVRDKEGNSAVGFISGVAGTTGGAAGSAAEYVSEDCLLITPVSEANTSKKIPDAARKELLDVYKALSNGTMVLPYEKLGSGFKASDWVVKDLFDISWLCTEHPAMLEPEGVTITLTFDLGVKKDTPVYVMTYKNNEWAPIVSTVNNGNGTITCVFEKFCPVAFIVPSSADFAGVIEETAPNTGDSNNVVLRGGVFALALAAVVGLSVSRRKGMSK